MPEPRPGVVWWRAIWPQEWLCLVLAGALAVLELIYRVPMPRLGELVLTSAPVLLPGAVALSWWLAARPVARGAAAVPAAVAGSRFAAVAHGLRVSFPPMVALYGYEALGDLIPRIRHSLADPLLISVDRDLFGTDVSRWLGDHLGSPALTTVLALCYLCCAWPQFLYGIHLYRRSTRRYHEFILSLAITYLLGYSGYLAVPGLGPHLYQAGIFAGPLPGDHGFTAGLLDSIGAAQSMARDIFPSLHTTLTVILLTALWRWSRRMFWCCLPVGLGLLAATQYLRVHYLIDLVAGLALAVFAIALARIVTRRWFPDSLEGTFPQPVG